MFLLFIEIVVVAVLARRLGAEAHDKGFSSLLFIVLTSLLWIGSRLIGNLLGHLIAYGWLIPLITGWLSGLITYGIFYAVISRLEDKYTFDTDNTWKNKNSTTQAEKEIEGEK